MLPPRGAQVDPGGLDAAVAQHVGQHDHIPTGSIESLGKKMPQVMGKDLDRLYPRSAAQTLHL